LKSAVYILIYEHLKKPSNAVIGPIEQFFKTLLDRNAMDLRPLMHLFINYR
jgi:hypothetical protein